MIPEADLGYCVPEMIFTLFFLDVLLGLALAHIGFVFLRRIDRSFPEYVCWCGYDLRDTGDIAPCPECASKKRRVFKRRPTVAHRVVGIAASACLPFVSVVIWTLDRNIKDWNELGFLFQSLTAPLLPFLYMIWRVQRHVSIKAYLAILVVPAGVLVLLWMYAVSASIRSVPSSDKDLPLLPYMIFAAPGTGLAFLISSAIAWSRLRYRPE